MDKLIAQVPLDALGPLPPEVTQARAQAEVMYVQVKAAVTDLTDKAYMPAAKITEDIITTFEKAVPAYKGLIRKTPGYLAVFIIYMSIVLYVILKVVFFVL